MRRTSKPSKEAIQQKIENLKYASDYIKVFSETYDIVCVPKNSKAFNEFIKLIELFNESEEDKNPLDLLKDEEIDLKIADAIAKISNDPMDQLLKICSELTQEEEEIPEVSCEFLQLIPTRNSPDRLRELYKECDGMTTFSCHMINEQIEYLEKRRREEEKNK